MRPPVKVVTVIVIVYGLTMAKCAEPNDVHELVDIPKNQIFAFHGFAEQSEDLAPALRHKSCGR